MTIKEVSETYHISQDTLRYYERVGMIPRVTRTPSGNRDYQPDDLGWVELAICMRNAGLPVEVMIEYVMLARKVTIPFRHGFSCCWISGMLCWIKRHRSTSRWERLNYKISRYEEASKNRKTHLGQMFPEE